MLYNQNWDAKTKPAISSLQGLIAWLETVPADVAYDFDCTDGGCLIGLYAAAVGVDFHKLHSDFYERDELHVAHNGDWTFGAALSRARADLARA